MCPTLMLLCLSIARDTSCLPLFVACVAASVRAAWIRLGAVWIVKWEYYLGAACRSLWPAPNHVAGPRWNPRGHCWIRVLHPLCHGSVFPLLVGSAQRQHWRRESVHFGKYVSTESVFVVEMVEEHEEESSTRAHSSSLLYILTPSLLHSLTQHTFTLTFKLTHTLPLSNSHTLNHPISVCFARPFVL